MAQTFETEHFLVEHHPNLITAYSVKPKKDTQAESDQFGYMLPQWHLRGADVADDLLSDLHKADAWYVKNRADIIRSRNSAIPLAEAHKRYAAARGE